MHNQFNSFIFVATRTIAARYMAKTKQLLIDAAREVFARLGVTRTTMNDIAEASNKGRRTLYTYFKSKEDVYMAVVSQELELLNVRLKQLMKTKLSPEEKLIEFIYTHLSTIDEIITNNGSLQADFFSDIKEVQQVRLRTDVQEMRMLRQLLTEGVEQGCFVDIDVEMATTIIFYSIRGLEVPYTKESVAERMQQRREHIANFIIKGLK